MSIATKKGDAGETSLIGGRRLSKGHARIEAIGEVDALGAHLAFARALCRHDQTSAVVKNIQRTLFAIGELLATERDANHDGRLLDGAAVDGLTDHVYRLEAIDGITTDWALAGDDVAGAAFEVARASCRRAERAVVRLSEAGDHVDPIVLAYLNRLSDLLWLMGRFVERTSGADTRLRRDGGGALWSRAW